MSSPEKRLNVFRKLTLRAQFTLIATSRDNPVLARDPDYISQLEAAHQECVEAASPEERRAYNLFMGNPTL